MSFEALVKQRLCEHDFKPICIEHEMKLVKARKCSRKYEQNPRRKEQHRKWAKTEAGVKSDRARGQRYRDRNKGNEEYRLRRRAIDAGLRRRRKLNALYLLLVGTV